MNINKNRPHLEEDLRRKIKKIFGAVRPIQILNIFDSGGSTGVLLNRVSNFNKNVRIQFISMGPSTNRDRRIRVM